MPAQFTLGKNERLKSRKIIEQLFAEGKSFTVFPLRVHYLIEGSLKEPLQAGFSASSRNFKNAVDRNRIRRLMREAYRLQKIPVQETVKKKQQQLALFVIYIGKEIPPFDLVKEKTGALLKKLTSILNEIPAPHS